MTSVLNNYFKERISLLLSEYLRDVSLDKIELNLGLKNTIVLQNLDIREDLLLMNSIPLVITEGKINRIEISVPALFKNTPARIDVENVMIRVRLLVEQRSNEDLKFMQKMKTTNPNPNDKTSIQTSYKEQKLKDWENKVRKYFKELAPPTWIKKILDNILKNMIINIKDLNIYYESFSLLSSPSLAKISLQELNLHSTNENWIPGFNSNSKVDFREILIKGLAVTLNINKPTAPLQGSLASKSRTTINFNTKKNEEASMDSDNRKEQFVKTKSTANLKGKSLTGLQHQISSKTKRLTLPIEELEAEYQKLRQNDIYLLFPLDLTIRMKSELDLSKDFENSAQKTITIEVSESIIFMLNKDHMKFLGALNEHLRLMNIVQKNLHLRPLEPPKAKTIKEWWIYAARAVLEEKKRQSDFSKDPGSLWKMKKYIDLYKRQQDIISVPWLPKITPKEEPLFKKLEEDIPLQNLIQFREWAFIEIRVEAKRFSALNKDVQGMKPLIDVWYHILNNDDMFKPPSENNFAETIRLTPLEQTDLYEILALDKAKVLESYLKGENNDPKDISMNLELNLRSFYVLISEPRWNTETLGKSSFVKSWYEQPGPSSPMNMKASKEGVTEGKKGSPGEQSLRSSEVFNQKLNLSLPNHNQTFHSIEVQEVPLTSTQKGIKFTYGSTLDKHYNNNPTNANEDHTRSPVNMRSQSFENHLKDIERDVESKYLINDTENDDDAEENQAESNVFANKPNSNTWWNQNLLLILEILQINTSMNKYRSGRLSIKKEEPLIFGSIMVTTASNLNTAVNWRKNKVKPSCDMLGLQYDTLLQNILSYDFNSVPSIGAHEANPMIAYLKTIGYANIASFLEIFEKDKRNSGEMIVGNIKAYKPFFTEDDPMYISCLKPIKLRFDNFLQLSNAIRESKERIIYDAFGDVEKWVTRHLLASFVFHHGILVLPLILQVNTVVAREVTDTTSDIIQKSLGNVINLLGRRKDTKKASQAAQNAALSLSFDIEGRESKFKIKKIDLPQSKINPSMFFNKSEMVRLAEEKENQEGQSWVEMNMQKVTINLSIESLKPLILFFKSYTNNTSEQVVAGFDEDIASVNDYETMIDCIHYNKDKEKEIHLVEGPKLEAKFESIEIKINSFPHNYRQQRELTFAFNDILFKVKNPNSSELAPTLETKRLQTYYRSKSLRIKEISLDEQRLTKDNSVEETINILKAGVSIYIYDCLYKNHPLYTDRKIHASIPYFTLTIHDNSLLLLQTIKLLNMLSAPNPNERAKQFNVKENLIMGTNQCNMLINRFKVLRNDHKSSNKACKHCILRYKKSQLVLNLFFGNLAQYSSTLVSTPFGNLIPKSGSDLPGTQGLLIKVAHSMTTAENKINQTLIYIPFLSITRDCGFFKDNIIVHSTESIKKPATEERNWNEIELKIKPLIKTSPEFMENLDEKFWRYFKDFEKFFKGEDDANKAAGGAGGGGLNESQKDQSKSSIRSEKAEGAKFFSAEEEEPNESNPEIKNEEKPKVYILFARKKILRKNLVKHFEVGETDLKNFVVFRLQEINVIFNSLKSFCGLKHTLDTLSYLNTWFTHFLGGLNLQRMDTLQASLQKASSKLWTLQNLEQIINSEDISILIKKIGFLINIKPPLAVWTLELNQIKIETFQKSLKSVQNVNNKRIWEIFSINNINFRLTSSCDGKVEKLKLKYYQNSREMKFGVKSVDYSYPNRKDQSLIRIPGIGASNPNKKALKAMFLFDNDKLNKVEVTVACISVFLSKLLVSEELTAYTIFSLASLQHKANLPILLSNEIFEKGVFNEIEQAILNDENDNYPPIPSLKFEYEHLGPIAATSDLLIEVNLELLTVNCITEGYKIFFKADISDIKYKLDSDGEYEVDFGKFHLIPFESYYGRMLVDLSQTQPIQIKIVKDTECALLKIKNSKIMYLERILAEIREFKKEIEAEIARNSLNFSEAKIHKSKPIRNQDYKTSNTRRNRTLKIEFENSCLVVPRTSNSHDVLVILFDKLEVNLDTDATPIEVPIAPAKPLAIVMDKFIIDNVSKTQEFNILASITTAKMTNFKVNYVNKGKRRDLGGSEKAIFTVTSPTEPVPSEWIFDSFVKGDFDILRLSLNLASLTEVDDLITENLKEQSPFFKFRAKNLAKTRIKLEGSGFKITLSKIMIDRTQALESVQKYKERNDEEITEKEGKLDQFSETKEGNSI